MCTCSFDAADARPVEWLAKYLNKIRRLLPPPPPPPPEATAGNTNMEEESDVVIDGECRGVPLCTLSTCRRWNLCAGDWQERTLKELSDRVVEWQSKGGGGGQVQADFKAKIVMPLLRKLIGGICDPTDIAEKKLRADCVILRGPWAGRRLGHQFFAKGSGRWKDQPLARLQKPDCIPISYNMFFHQRKDDPAYKTYMY